MLPAISLVKERGIKCIIIPFDNLEEGLLINNLNIWGVKTLKETLEIVEHLNNNIFPTKHTIDFTTEENTEKSEETFEYDFNNIKRTS